MNIHLEIDIKIFFLILAAVCVILMLLVLLCGKENRRRILAFFVEELDAPPKHVKNRPSGKSQKSKKKKRAEDQIRKETALLYQKVDERRRIIDSNGHSTLYDEYFELVFETKKGKKLHLVTTRAAFKEVPFHQEGTLTYKDGKLLTFQYSGGLISDERSPLLDAKIP